MVLYARMPSAATMDDFIELIDQDIEKAMDRVHEAVNRVRSEFTRAGAFHGSRRALFSVKAAQTEFEAGVETVLGDLDWAVKDTLIDEGGLREQTEQRLTQFAEKVKVATRVDDMASRGVGDAITTGFLGIDKYLKTALRLHEIGHRRKKAEEPLVVDNSIKVSGDMMGNIQHSSPGATQSFHLNVESARNAIDALEAELAKIAISDHAQLNEIAGDVATIKGQLLKATPSLPILHEAGKSLRKITENVVAGVLTHPALQAAIALCSSLGMN